MWPTTGTMRQASLSSPPAGEIRLVYLPPYTPQLNSIEIQWRVLKDMLAGRYFGSTDDLICEITNLIDLGQMKPVKLMNYLSH